MICLRDKEYTLVKNMRKTKKKIVNMRKFMGIIETEKKFQIKSKYFLYFHNRNLEIVDISGKSKKLNECKGCLVLWKKF